MSMMDSARNGRTRNIDAWATLGMMKKAEEVQNTVEMLGASMEDLFDQIEILNANLEYLSDAAETIQEKMEEIVEIMNGEMYPDTSSPLIPDSGCNPLPF